MKKITVLNVLVSNSYNGAENVVCQISDLFKSDDNIEIIYCSPDGPIRNALKEHGIRFIPLKNISVKELRRVIVGINPSIIHAHDMRASFLTSIACKGIPLISHIHNNNFDSRGLTIKSLLFFLAALKAKHIFWVSRTSYDGYYLKKYLKNKSEILYNVINVDNLKLKASKDKDYYDYDFVFIGRLTFQKNPQRLVKVMEQVVKLESKIKFAILGEGELADEIKEYIDNHNLSQNINFLGYNSNPYKILQCCKGLLMTSRWEGLPMCALEAFALGVPVVSTPADGLKELVTNEVNGFLSDSNEILISQIIKIYKDSNYREVLSEGAILKTLEIMDLNKYKERLRIVYELYSKI